MDGFAGFRSATSEELPKATAVMGPFHVVRLGVDALDSCRRRIQQATCAARATPLYRSRRTLHTGTSLLTKRQTQRLEDLFADERHLPGTWDVYQRMIASLARGVPDGLSEIVTLGRPLNRRAVDALAYFDRPSTSNGPTEAIDGRLEHLRGLALGFRDLTNYTARSLLEGGFRSQLHPHL